MNSDIRCLIPGAFSHAKLNFHHSHTMLRSGKGYPWSLPCASGMDQAQAVFTLCSEGGVGCAMRYLTHGSPL